MAFNESIVQKTVENPESFHCLLCNQQISSQTSPYENGRFCCVGCRTVYTILSSRDELAGVHQNPLFQAAVKSGLISNPSLLDEIRLHQKKSPVGESERIYFEISDLWCPSCAEVIRLVLLRESGVRNCVVDYATDLASVEYYPKIISKDTLLGFVQRLGYSPSLFENESKRSVNSDLYLRVIIAAFFSSNIMMFAYPIYASYFSADPYGNTLLFSWLSFFCSLPVLFYSGWPIFKRFFQSIIFGIMGMETLIVIGVLSSFGLSIYDLSLEGTHVYFDSMSVIITFVLLGKIIESRAKFSARETLFRLSKSLPKRGRKLNEEGKEIFVLLKEVRKGDLLVALSGEKIVLDGVVVEGNGTCDESLMTGEAVPLRKSPGEKVIGGTVVCQGRIVYRVETNEKETALHHIIKSIEEDIGHKSQYSRAVDPIVRKFVPLVLFLASISCLGVWFVSGSLQEGVLRAVSILLISCPCAIGIAAPIAESQILNRMATCGAIVRNRGCLSELNKVDLFVFDKTGTITEGCFRVLFGLETLSTQQAQILKAISSHTGHPMSLAIFRYLPDSSLRLEKCEEIPGIGVKGLFEGTWYFLGSKELIHDLDLSFDQLSNSREEVISEVYFATKEKLIARIKLGDQVRVDAVEALKHLKPARTVLLSGDGENSVEVVARKCGFDRWKNGITPLGKRDFIDQLRRQGHVVCMMGDGMNDAPALTGANIGISVVTATDLSIQVSDIMLTTERLNILPKLLRIAVKGQKILLQNLFWAFIYNIIGIALAMCGYLNPLISSAAMVLSSLIVIMNAQRIKD